MRKNFASGRAIVLLVGFLVGSLAQVLAGSVPSGTITVWGWGSPDSLAEKTFAATHPSIKVNYVKMDWSSVNQKLLAALVAGTGAPDVANIEIKALAQFMARAKNGGIVDLSKRAAKYKKDILPYSYSLGLAPNGKLLGIPNDAAPAIIFYQRDAFKTAGVKAESIKSWADLIEAGKKMSANSDGKIKLCSTAAEIFYYSFFLNDGMGGLIGKNGKITIATRFKEALAALSLARQAVDAGVVAQIGSWTNEWYAGMKNGNIAVYPSGCWLGGGIKNDLAPDTAGKWGAMALPQAKQGFTGGTWAVIPEQSKNKEAAWEYIRWMNLTPDGSKLGYVSNTWQTIPAISSAYDDPIFYEPDEFFAGQKVGELYIQVARKAPAMFIHEKDQEAFSLLNAELNKCLIEKSISPETCLNNAIKAIRAKGLGR